MKLFIRGLPVFGLLLVFLICTGCNSVSTLDDLPAAGKAPATGKVVPVANEVARFHIGETVSVVFSGTPNPNEIPAHDEAIKEDGNITLPLVGQVMAVGKTAGELQNEIHDLYVPKYYVRLNIVVKPGDLIYYVRGEVKSPGRQLYVGETTVTKAITSAGDFTDYASHKVTLIRAGGSSLKVNVDKALENPTLDPQIYPGDQIDVPRRFLMIQLNILSGKKAGTRTVARRFPFRIGRVAGNGLQLEDDGVWDQHLTLAFQPQSGFNLATAPDALATVNATPVQNAVLRNGDILTVGSVKIQFWIAAARQRSLLLRESFVWALLVLVTIFQFALLYWLVR